MSFTTKTLSMPSTIAVSVGGLNALLVTALTLGLAACGSNVPSPQPSRDTVSPRPSATAVVPSSLVPSSPISATLPDLSQSPHAGALLTSVQGTGPREIRLSEFATGSHQVAIRFACVGGTTGAQLTDLLGGVVLGVSGCDGHGIYGADFTSSAKDAAIRIGVEPGVSWEIAVFWAL